MALAMTILGLAIILPCMCFGPTRKEYDKSPAARRQY